MRRRNTVHRDVASEREAVRVERAARRLLAGNAKVVREQKGGPPRIEPAGLDDVPGELRERVEKEMDRIRQEQVDG